MRRLFALSIMAMGVIVLGVFVQLGFSQDVTNIGDGSLAIFVNSVETGSSFPAFKNDKLFTNENLGTVKASQGNILVRIKCVVKNESRSTQQSFRLGDIQMTGNNKKINLVAVGLGEHPVAKNKSDMNRYKNVVEKIESYADRPPQVYRFPIYIFEVPENCISWKLAYKNSKWVELKGMEKKGD